MKIDDRIEWGGIWLRGFIENTFANRRMVFFYREMLLIKKVIKRKFLPVTWKESPYNYDLVGLGVLCNYPVNYSFSKRMFEK